MSSILQIQAVLAKQPGVQMPGYRLAMMAGISFKTFSRRAPEMVRRNQIHREKLTGGTTGFYCYWMTEEQVRAYRLRAALENGGAGFDGALVTDTDDIHDRLKFLRMLKEKTVFGEHAMLSKVIDDYERTLALRNKATDQGEEIKTSATMQRKPRQIGRRPVPIPLAEFNGWSMT